MSTPGPEKKSLPRALRSLVVLALAGCATAASKPSPAHPPASPPLAWDVPACARTVPVSGGALVTALAAALPGDCLIVADGAYGDLTLTGKGTAAAPIQVRAANLLKATAGALVLTRSAHVVVQGFSVGTVLVDNCDYCRITRCQVTGGPGPAWIRIDVQKGCMGGCTDAPPGTSDLRPRRSQRHRPGQHQPDIYDPHGVLDRHPHRPQLHPRHQRPPRDDRWAAAGRSSTIRVEDGHRAEPLHQRRGRRDHLDQGRGHDFRYNTIRKTAATSTSAPAGTTRSTATTSSGPAAGHPHVRGRPRDLQQLRRDRQGAAEGPRRTAGTRR